MEGTVKKQIGIAVCLNGSDGDDIHNSHLVILEKGSIRRLEVWILANLCKFIFWEVIQTTT